MPFSAHLLVNLLLLILSWNTSPSTFPLFWFHSWPRGTFWQFSVILARGGHESKFGQIKRKKDLLDPQWRHQGSYRKVPNRAYYALSDWFFLFALFGPTSLKDSSAQTRSMSTFRRALEHPFSQHVRFTTLSSLLQALFTRPMRSFQGHCTQDPDKGVRLHSACQQWTRELAQSITACMRVCLCCATSLSPLHFNYI